MTTSDKEFSKIVGFKADLTPGNVKAAMSGNKSSDLWKVYPKDVKIIPGYNPRIRNAKYAAKIRWLADQMKEHGYYPDKPLAGFVAVENGKQVIYLQDGEGRHEAAMLAISEGAPFETVPMVMKDRTSGMLGLSIALVTSNEGEPFGPMEKAAMVQRFKAFGKSDGEIAVIMRCTPAYVGQLGTLAGAPQKIRDMVANEEISATHAIEMMRKHQDGATDVLEEAVKTAKAKGKTKGTAKDDKASALLSRQKAAGPELYRLIGEVLDFKNQGKKLEGEAAAQLDSLLFRIENGPPKKEKIAKPPKVVKPKPVKAAPKPKAPLAKKIARATKKA